MKTHTYHRSFLGVSLLGAVERVRGAVLAVVAAGLFLPAALYANPQAETYGGLGRPEDPVPFMRKARTGTLSNGLRYYILENARPENRAFLTLVVNAGSVLEAEDERGFAHFIEHMAFNGTERFPEAELVEYLRSAGMRFGADANAYTSFDETNYGIEVPVELDNGIKKIPAKALAVLDDWSRAVAFAPKDVDEERGVIMEEYRSRLGAADRVITQQLLPSLFKGSLYASRLPIGLPEIIQTAQPDQLKAFYRRWYRPDNMAVILVGDFDGAVLEAELESHFSAPAPSTPLVRPEYDLAPPRPASFSSAVLTDPEFPAAYVYLYYKEPMEKAGGDLAGFRNGLADQLIDQMLESRFYEAAMHPDAPYVEAGSWRESYGASSRFRVLAAGAKINGAEEALRALLLEKRRIDRYGFTEAEIDRAKRAVLSSLRQRESEHDRTGSGEYVARFSAHFLKGEAAPDSSWELGAAEYLVPEITARELMLRARSYFVANDLSVYILAPESEARALPSQTRVWQVVIEAAGTPLRAPEEEALDGELLAEAPRPGEIRSEERDEETGALVWRLSNGATVIVKETANQNNQVVLIAQARGGLTSAPAEGIVSARMSADLLNASGMGPYTRQELLKKLAGKQVQLSFSHSAWTRSAIGASSSGDLKTLFELLYLGFTQPRIDADSTAVVLEQYRTALAQQAEAPLSAYSNEVSRLLVGGDPYFRPLTPEDLDRVTREEALDFARRTLNPADYVFTFTGNIDLGLLREYTEAYLAAMPQTEERFNEWENQALRRPGLGEWNMYKGIEEQSYVYMAYYSGERFSEQGSAASEALTQYLEIALVREIREKRGGVYSIAAQASLQPLPLEGELGLNIFFGCDPERAGELREAVKAELERVARGEIDQDTFDKAVEALRKGYEVSLQNNSYIAQSYSNSAVIYRSPLSRLNQRLSLYEALEPADLAEMAARLLSNGAAEFMLYPENRG
jgi:zinc protease